MTDKKVINNMKSVKDNREKGNIGEDIACKFIVRNGFKIACRNFRKKWGEADIIAEKDNVMNVFEVKSAVANLSGRLSDSLRNIRPEENVDSRKVRRLRRIIRTYMSQSGAGLDTEFNFHVICVFMDMSKRIARVKWLKNIVL